DPALLDRYLGPARGEVVELLGIDLGERRGGERTRDPARRRAGRLPRIVPAFEGEHQRRLAQDGPHLEAQRVGGHLRSFAAARGPGKRLPSSAHELVTVASHGQDVPRARRVALDVAAQARDEAVDHASASLGPQPPYVLEQLAARHGAALA